MGFLRGVGYFFNILLIIGGLLICWANPLIGIPIIFFGVLFIWLLKRGASQERMEKYLKQIRDSQESEEDHKKRKHQEDPNHCVNCGKFMFWDNTKELCKDCSHKEKLRLQEEKQQEHIDSELAKLDPERNKSLEEDAERRRKNLEDWD